MSKEDSADVYSGLAMAPKILADIVESVAAAIYVDVDFDLERLWVVRSYCSFFVVLMAPNDEQ